VQCNFSEGIQEHREGEQQRVRRGSHRSNQTTKRPKDSHKRFPTRDISSPVGKTIASSARGYYYK
jgi:hypothetical protein